jgi:RHS repeat-associated protein
VARATPTTNPADFQPLGGWPQPTLYVQFYNAQNQPIGGLYEKPLFDYPGLIWAQLQLRDLPVPCGATSAEVWAEYSSNTYTTWFDDFEITLLGAPVAEIVQESHNDPWGLELSGLNYQNGRKNQWQANGKTEIESNFGMNILETPFRGYDPALGRFHQPDAITDLLPGISSYTFAFNNPVYFNDPTGLVGEGGSGQDKGVIPPGKRTVDKYGGWVWSAGAMANTAKPSSSGFPPIPDPLKVGGGGGQPASQAARPTTSNFGRPGQARGGRNHRAGELLERERQRKIDERLRQFFGQPPARPTNSTSAPRVRLRLR